MRSVRTIVYAALMLSVLAIQPSLAAAEDAHGNFTLPHDAHLQNEVLPAGDYSFSLKPAGPAEILLLRGLGKTSFGAIMLVTSVEASKPHDISRVVLVSKHGQSYISTIELPQFDMVLRFKVPSADDERRTTASAAMGAGAAR
jgi:hypothetical protein